MYCRRRKRSESDTESCAYKLVQRDTLLPSSASHLNLDEILSRLDKPIYQIPDITQYTCRLLARDRILLIDQPAENNVILYHDIDDYTEDYMGYKLYPLGTNLINCLNIENISKLLLKLNSHLAHLFSVFLDDFHTYGLSLYGLYLIPFSNKDYSEKYMCLGYFSDQLQIILTNIYYDWNDLPEDSFCVIDLAYTDLA